MAREFEKGPTRVVFTGDANLGPKECWCEYRVVDGDLAEAPKKFRPENEPDYTEKSNAFWAGMMASIAKVEGIS